jgi:hypothetical protein
MQDVPNILNGNYDTELFIMLRNALAVAGALLLGGIGAASAQQIE